MKNIVFIIMLVCVTAFLSAQAYAADEPKMSVREACKTDVEAFCDDIKPGSGRVIKCLKDHYKKLSDDCYVALNKGLMKKQDDSSEPPASDSNASPDDKE